MELIILVLVLIVIGALLGGNSFGECLRIGCGCLVMAIIGAGALMLFGLWAL